MTYTITNYDGTPLVSVADQTFDTTSTSLTLVGRANLNYGMMFNQNIVNLLENFSRTTAPTNPLLGQLWFDKGNNVLKIKDSNGFEPLATQSYGATNYVGSAASGAQPLTISGDAQGTMGVNTTPFNLILDVNFPVTSVNGTVGAANVSYSNITGYAPDLYPSQDGAMSVANTLTVGSTSANSVGEIDFGSSGVSSKIVASTSSLTFTSNGSGPLVLDNAGGLTVAGGVNAKAGTYFFLDTNSFITRASNALNFTVAGGSAMSYTSGGDLSLPSRLYVGATTAYVGATSGSLTLAASGGPAASLNAAGVLTAPTGLVVQSATLVGGVPQPAIVSAGPIVVQAGGITTAGAITVQAGGMNIVGDVHGFGSGDFDGNLTVGSGGLFLNFAAGSTTAEILFGNATNTKIFYDDGANLQFSSGGGPVVSLNSNGNLSISGALGTSGAANIGGGAVIAGDVTLQDGTLYVGSGAFGEIIFGGAGSAVKIDYNAASGTLWCSNGGNSAIITTTSASDEKLKKNISPHNDALAVMRAVEVVNFEYRKDSGYHDGKKHIGFLAQQLATLVPVAVQEGKGMLHVNKQELVPHLVRAVQQLADQNEALMARLEKLEGKPDA